jgi:nuclear pore complex protein Nup160
MFHIISSQKDLQPRKRRKLSKNIPDSKYAVGKYDSEIIDLADIQYEYALLCARLDLVRKDPSLLPAGGKL